MLREERKRSAAHRPSDHPAMTAPVLSARGKFLTFFILAVIGCTLVAAAAQKTGVTFASELNDSAVATRAPFFSVVELPKPTYTFVPPTQAPTAISVELTATSESLAPSVIVPDTPASDYSAQNSTANDPSHPADPAYSGNKYILIDISEQHMYAYEGNNEVFSFVASTGMNNATRVGSFSVLDKIPNAYGATWDLWMPNWLGIYYAGSLENGIHALPILSNGTQLWAGYLGTPISFGCIVLGVNEAQALYDWADVGTPVTIQW